MNIIILIKQVPDPKAKIELKADGTIDRERIKPIINPYDRHALEAALVVKEKHGGRIICISMGPQQAVEVLLEAIAMGADDGILLCDRRLAGSDTLSTSYALAQTIKKVGNFDLILCGMETIDGNTGQVGPEIAEHLGIPQITYVEEIVVKGSEVEAKRLVEGGYEWIRTKLPALLTITNTANEPRYPSILGIVRAKNRKIPTWTIDDIGINEAEIGLRGSPTKLIKIEKPKARAGECVLFKENEVDEFLERLKKDKINLVFKK